MNSDDEKLLEENGWIIECESPFEISTKDGSFARDEGAYIVLESLKYERDNVFSLKDMRDSFNAGMNRGVYVASTIMNKPIDNEFQTFNEFISDYDEK
jgi:hypothetical protein